MKIILVLGNVFLLVGNGLVTSMGEVCESFFCSSKLHFCCVVLPIFVLIYLIGRYFFLKRGIFTSAKRLQVQLLIRNNRLKEALTSMESYFAKKGDDFSKQQAIQLLARLSQLKDAQISGTISSQEAGVMHANIISGALHLASRMC